MNRLRISMAAAAMPPMVAIMPTVMAAVHSRGGKMLAIVTGLIPCPLTTFIVTYALTRGMLATGLAVNVGSHRAMALASDPGQFISTVQIGITLVVSCLVL